MTLQFRKHPPLSSVPIPLSHTPDPQKFQLLSKEVDTLGKDGSGGSSCIIDRSRILFSSLHCSEEDRGNVTSPQHLLGCSPLQNGDQSFYQSFDSSRFVDHFPGSFRLLFPYSYLPFILQIPSVCLGQQSLPIQSSSIRPVDCTTSFYQSYAGSHSSSSYPSYSDSFLYGRLSTPM